MAVVLVYAALAATVAGTAYSAYSSHKQEKDTREAARDQQDIEKQRLKQLLSHQKTLYAKAGVDISSGSPLIQLQFTAKQGNLDIGINKKYNMIKSRGYRSETGSTILSGLSSSLTQTSTILK